MVLGQLFTLFLALSLDSKLYYLSFSCNIVLTRDSGGYLLWRMFLDLDSHRFPLKTYGITQNTSFHLLANRTIGDIAYRIYGQYARHMVNILQSIQLLLAVSIIIVRSPSSH